MPSDLDDRDPIRHGPARSAPTVRGAAVAVPPAPSPCVGVCRIVEGEGRCAGCLRTLGEIAGWGRLDDAARHALLDVLKERRIAAGWPASEEAPGDG